MDAIVIATNPEAHFALAKHALEMGKHVLVEKPFTMQTEEARELLELSSKVNLICAVSHNFIFSRSFRKLKQLIEKGDLGQITGVEGVQMSNPSRRLPTWYNSLPLGLFYDESPHLLYLVRNLAGCNPKLCNAHIIPSQKGENTPYSMSLSYEGDAFPIRLSMLFNAPLSEWRLMVMGTQKIAIVDIFRDVLIVANNDAAHKGKNILQTSFSFISSHLIGTMLSGYKMVSGNLYYGTELVIDQFIHSIQVKKNPADISSKDGFDIVQMQHAILSR